MDDIKYAHQSKTICFNLAIGILSVIADQYGLLRNTLSDQNYLFLLMAVSVINVFLRTLTTQPVKLK